MFENLATKHIPGREKNLEQLSVHGFWAPLLTCTTTLGSASLKLTDWWFTAAIISGSNRYWHLSSYLNLAISEGTGQACLGVMRRLRNPSHFIVPAELWRAILHLFVMQSACMLAHIILSVPLPLPPPSAPFSPLLLKMTSRFMPTKERWVPHTGRNRDVLTSKLVGPLLISPQSSTTTTSVSAPGNSLLILKHGAYRSKLMEITQSFWAQCSPFHIAERCNLASTKMG